MSSYRIGTIHGRFHYHYFRVLCLHCSNITSCLCIYNTHDRLYYALCEQSFIQPIIICNVLASVVHTLVGVKHCYLVKFTELKFVFSVFYRSSGIQYSAGFVVQ